MLNKNYPKISIITPTYNVQEDIEKCILSVVNQSYKNIEYLIIDNLSSDKTLDIVKKYSKKYPQIRYVSEKDEGIYDAMNKGIELSDGEWIYFLGADDTLLNKFVLDKVFYEIDDSNKFDFLYGDVIWILGNIEKIYDGRFSTLKIIEKNICHQAIFCKKEIYYNYGKFDVKYSSLADWEFNMKIFSLDEVRKKYIDVVIAKYKVDGFSFRNIDTTFKDDYLKLINKRFLQENSYFLTNKEKDKIIQEKDREINNQIQQRHSQINNLNNQINYIQSSKFWKLRENYLHHKNKIKFAIFCPKKFIKKYLKF